ncbi:alpha-(1-_3)-arabinofuranosyltransferase domain-containing protein [Frankia sp. Cas4]|uniref:alpha-(1->3)-arabinofuranosyltransferase domain-containing protein n=1 Tax=Frankia sp. Cas4 TaxID=3073927 RepID=UPI002AD31FF8|nr:alpha-(1->3)-arabinofuranosyltransferase family protein [Frankia sp. Cas4]
MIIVGADNPAVRWSLRSSSSSSSPSSPSSPSPSGPQGGALVAVSDHLGRTPRWSIAAMAAGFVLLCLLQAPGRLAADTKLDLAVDPAGFLAASTHLWRSSSDFGLLPNQYVGYLFPMGSFFAGGKVLGLPPWVTQRLWMALILTVASWGVIRLADTLRVGGRTHRVIGGIAYSVSPFVLGKIGSTSVALTGSAMLPWMVLPLVLAVRRDSSGSLRQLSPRRAAALSGLAIFATGGVNASVTLDVLLCPAVVLVLAGTDRRAWALRGWWILSVLLATGWWVLALATQRRYGLNFLPYTETAVTTTATTSVGEALRGASDWMAYLRLPSPWLPAASEYVTTFAAVLGSGLVAALGVWGLARADLPARRFLVLTFGVGVVAICAAYPGQPASPLADTVRDLFGAPFGFLRNVYKFQPVVRLPMALGLAHALSVAASWRRPDRGGAVGGVRRRDPIIRFIRRGRPVGRRRVAARRPGLVVVVVTVVTAACVIAGMTPALAGKLTPAGTFRNVPGYWGQAAQWLARNPAGGRTLVLPGTAFGEYSWGRPLDEPMQWLAQTPWGVRSLIPLGGTGVIRWMDGIERQLTLGSAPGLAEALARAGIGQVLVRNDLQNKDWDVPPSSAQISGALRGSGLQQAARFGPMLPARSAGNARLVPALRNPTQRVPALEVWVVPGGASMVQAYPAATALIVSGGAEATVEMAAQRVLPDQAAVLAGDLAATAGPTAAGPTADNPTAADPAAADVVGPRTTWVVTDTFTRRDNRFGLVHGAQSYVLGPHEDVAGATGPPDQWTDRPAAEHQTTAGYVGGMSVTASSYGFELVAAPDLAPANAVDGDPSSAWQSLRTDRGSAGQWLQVDVARTVEVPTLTVQLLEESPSRPTVRALRVTTQAGSVVTPVKPIESAQQLAVPTGPTRWFRVGFEQVAGGGGPFLGAGIRELTIPGIRFQRYLQAPSDMARWFSGTASGRIVYAFARNRADPSQPFEDDEERQLSRRFDVPRPLAFTVRGAAVPIAPLLTGAGGMSDGRQDGTGGQSARGDGSSSVATGPGQSGTEPVALPCGSGPMVIIDGQRYSTRLDGRPDDAGALRSVTMSLCTDGGTVTLSAGPHLLTTEPGSAPFAVGSLTLVDGALAAPSVPVRGTRITGWTSERRTVEIAAGERSYLAVRENANASWTATVNGVSLPVIRLDGWQQGWIIPAGVAGTIVIVNRPGQTYRRDLGVGMIMVAGLIALAVLPAGLRKPAGRASRGQRTRRWGTRRWGTGRWGTGRWVRRQQPEQVRDQLRYGVIAAGMCAVTLVAGPVALVIPALVAVARRWSTGLSWLAAGCVGAAVTVVALTPDSLPGSGRGAFGWQVQLCGAGAFACVLTSTAVRRVVRPADRPSVSVPAQSDRR